MSNKISRGIIATLISLAPIAVFGQTTGTLTMLPPSGGGGAGTLTTVGDCSTDPCFQAEDTGTFLGAPLGGGVATFRAITEADLPAELATDLELIAAITAHAGEADAHHVWPLTDAEVPDDITVDLAATATALAADGTDCASGEYARGVDAQGNAQGCTPDDTGTDDQTASEVPYTPATGEDWDDPDPEHVAAALDVLAGRESGGVAGPATSTNNAIATWDGAGGDAIADSTLLWDGADLTLPVSTQVQLPYGSAADPSIEFASGSGFSGEASNSNLVLVVAGNPDWTIGGCGGPGRCISASTGSGPAIYNSGQSTTAPNIVPSKSANSSGLGGLAGSPALIASGTSRVTATSTGATIGGNLTISGSQVNSPLSQTCVDSGDGSPGTLVASVSGTSYKKITNSDADGCALTLSETGAIDGQALDVIVVSSAGGTVTAADTAGIQEAGSGCAMALSGASTWRYNGTAWILTGCEPTN